MTQDNISPTPLRSRRPRWPYICLAIVLLAGATILWLYRDQIRSPRALYEEARAAKPHRAVSLYALLAKRVPELEEYWELWSAQALLPAFEAVETLHSVAVYRPDSPAAYHAHLALARYYASIESFETDNEYLAALDMNDTIEVRLELARYLEEQGNPSAAYKQYLEMLGPRRPDAFTGMRRTAPSPLVVASDLLGRSYCSDALEVLRGIDSCDAHCTRARALACLGQDDEAAVERRACRECTPPEPASEPEEEEPVGEEPVSEEERLLASDDPLDWWRATWDMDEAGRYAEVVPIYLRIAESDLYVSDDAAYRAWVLARRELQDPLAEARALSLLQSVQPNWLASRATGTLTWEMAPDYPESAVDELTSVVMSKAEALASLGRDDLAYQEVRLTALLSETPEVLLGMAEEMSARGHIVPACTLARAHLRESPYAPRRFWELAYPRAYEDEVTQVATEYGVDPELIWAIMRQESLYGANLVSSAGARGLMQIMGALQADACNRVGAGCVPGDAYQPGPSIKMGTWYLSLLLGVYDGDADLAIMAYNAGPGNVNAWRDLPTGQDGDDLLRFALFGETREYLERVSLDRLIYMQLY
ncbi:MAG: lytic transglycosylase domain-containing protein [Anaerolineae bacterium]|nr:lytic transglycosylase domain-containing protein [Anaerolineae bacterium]